MRIISYNVNGIRAAISKGFIEWLQHSNPDVICLQEIKATEDQVPYLDIEMAGYPYQYYFPATKKGYSGVAILSKVKPNNIVLELELSTWILKVEIYVSILMGYR